MFGFFKKPETREQDKTTESKGWVARLRAGLSRTRTELSNKLTAVFKRGKIDDALYEELETVLITSDIGIAATERVLANLRSQVKQNRLTESTEVKAALQSVLVDLLTPLEKPFNFTTYSPFIIMVAGVNGAGKTTTIGKLAKYFQ